jgi:hypothetical protein
MSPKSNACCISVHHTSNAFMISLPFVVTELSGNLA